MKVTFPKSLLSLLLVASMLLSMVTPAAGLVRTVSAAETDMVDYDAMSVEQILELDKELTWVFAGDSITHNASFTNGMNSYPEWFEQYLYTLGREDKVINTAWGGADIRDFLYYDDTPGGQGLKASGETGMGIENMITNYDPDVVFIKLGMNNRAMATAEFETYYKKMLDAVYAEGAKHNKIPKVIVITPTPLGGDSLQGKEYYADKINQAGADNVWRFQMILEKLVPAYNAANGRHMEFVDFMTGVTSEALTLGGAYAGTFFVDGSDGGLHPNQAAQYLMFNILCKTLELYDESNPVFGFTYDDINNRAHYTDDTYISDYTGDYHNANDVVAMVGNKGFDSLTNAIAAAVEAGTATVTLCKDVEITTSLQIPAGANITLTVDGSAHVLTRDANFTGAIFDVTGSLTLTGALTLDGANVKASKSAVAMNSGAEVKVDGVSFQNLVSSGTGGAISLGTGTLTVGNAVFTGNTGSVGGGIYAGNNAVVEITGSTFTSNKATGNGGALYFENKSSAKVTGCRFEGNDAPSGSAIQIAADNGDYRLTVKNCDFIGNKTHYAIHAWRDAYITLDGCQFTGNAAGDVYFVNNTNGKDTKPDDQQFVYILSSDRAAIGQIYLENNVYPVRIGGTLAEGSNIKLNWKSVPTGTAVQFDDETAAQANTEYLYLADTYSVNYVLSYEGAVAKVIEKPQVSYVAKLGDVSYETYDELTAAVGALVSGAEATVTVLADVVATSPMTVPAGVTLTIIDDGTARTIYRDVSLTGSMFVVNGALNFSSTATTADVVSGAATGAASKLTINGNAVVQTAEMVALANNTAITVNQGVRFTNVAGNNCVIRVDGSNNTLTLNGGVFDNCNSGSGWCGAIGVWNGNTFGASNAVFSNNTATGGAGVLNLFKPANDAYTVENCVFTGNVGGQGGTTLLNANAIIKFIGCTFSNNSATSRGGAIQAAQATNVCYLYNCKFTGNVVGTADNAVQIQNAAGKVIVDDATTYTGKEAYVLTNAQVTSTAAATMLAEQTEQTTAASWTSLLDENNTWIIAGPEQVFGFQSLNAHRSIFRLMEGTVRYEVSYKDNRFVQAHGETVQDLLDSFDADIGMMAQGQDIDVYLLIPQVNGAFEAGYVHSAEQVASYKAAVQGIADKAKAAGLTLVLWTPLAAADDTVNGYLADYAEAIRQIDAGADHILLFDAYKFMNEHMRANVALENNWFTEGANISPLLANDIVRAFWSKPEMCLDGALAQVRDHNLRIGTDRQIHKGKYIADGISYGVSVNGERVTVDASAILSAYPEMTNLRVAVLPVAGCGNYNDAIWQDYAAIENGTATFDAPWDNAAITVYGELNGYTYRFKDVTLSVSVANYKTLPVYTTDALTDLRVVGAPDFNFDAATNTYTVNLYQYQKLVQIKAEGGKNLTVTVNGEEVQVGELSQQIEVAGKTATVIVTVTGGAADATYTLNLVKPDYPDIIITEVMEDPKYSSGLYEMVELYNASGKDLNIKDYSLGYKFETAHALITDNGSGNPVDGGMTPYLFTGDNHIFHAISGNSPTYTSFNSLTANSAFWADAVEPETVNFPADSTMVVWIKQNWQDTKDTESYEDLINAVKNAAGDTTLVVEIDGEQTPVAPAADKLIMAEDPTGNDGGQEKFSAYTSENASKDFYLENGGADRRFWLFVAEADAVRDDDGSITEAGDDIISAARWNRITSVQGMSAALLYNADRGFAMQLNEDAGMAAYTKTTFGAIEYWQKPYDLTDETAPNANVVYNDTGITVTLTDDTDVRYLYLQIDGDGDGTYETEIKKDLVLEAGVKNAGVSADQTSYTYTYAGACVNYNGYVLDGNNNKTELATPVTVAMIGNTSYGSLKAAVEAANAMESATIVLMMDTSLDETITVSGNVTITDNGSKRTLTRVIANKLFDVTGTLNFVGTAEGMLVLDGDNVAATTAVFAVSGSIHVKNTEIYNMNSGAWGSNLFYLNKGPASSFENVKISGGSGQVIYVQGAASDGNAQSFTNCIFENRTGNAAGIIMNGTNSAKVEITGCDFINNSNDHMGAVYVEKSTYTITDCTFECNKSTGNNGGAVVVANSNTSVANITGCTFTGNSAAKHGGAIYARGASCTLNVANSSFSGNTAGTLGTDIMAEATSKVTLDGCNLANEVYMVDASTAVTVKATEQVATMTLTLAKGTVNVVGTLAQGSAIVLNVPANTAITFDSAEAATANVACLSMTEEMVKAGYQICVDGATATVMIPAKVAQVGDTQYDTLAEAFAAANKLENATVTLLADCTITETITVSGNVTLVDSGNAVTITRATNETLFNVTGTLNITGTAASAITLDGAEVASTVSAFLVTGTVNMTNVDIKDMNSGAWANGALIYLNKGPASSFSNVKISGGSGQVFYIQGAASDSNAQIFTNCTFENRTGSYAGLIFNGAGSTDVDLIGCQFVNNVNGHRGAVYADNSYYTIENCTFTGNQGNKDYAGAICMTKWSQVTVTGTTISGNSAKTVGAGIYAVGGGGSTLIIDGCTISDEIYIEDGATVHTTFKSTDKALNAKVTMAEGSVAVAGELMDGSTLNLTWKSIPAGKAVVCDSYCAVLSNMDNIIVTNADCTVTTADDSSVITLYNKAVCLEDVYIATTGADTNAGTADAPVLTLNRALELVQNGGTIHIVDSYVAASGFVWENHNKDVTITGGTLDLSQGYTQVTDGSYKLPNYYQGDAVTFDDTDLILANYAFYFANGHRLQINENVTVTSTDLNLFGGGANGHTVYGTDVKLLGGDYWKIYGGGRKADVIGDVNLYVGNINADRTVAHDGTSRMHGGGYKCNVDGDINLTIAGAKVDYINGGNEMGGSESCTVSGKITVLMTGGEAYSLYGGHRASMDDGMDATQTGDISLTITGGTVAQVFGANQGCDQIGNVTVHVKGGTITRRFFGGCYNNWSLGYSSDYHVIGDVKVYLYEDATLSWNTSEDDNGFYAHSRYDLLDEEVTYLYYVGAAAQSKHSGSVASQNADMSMIMGSSTSVADNIGNIAVSVYTGTELKGYYATMTDAIADLTENQYIKLEADISEDVTLTRDLYIDLNGCTVTGTLTAGDFKVYGMDSTTDNYSCESMGYFNMATDAVVAQFKTDITGEIMRYMAISTDSGYTFHRFYLGITKQTLVPAKDAVGYKATFYGDSMVLQNVSGYGYSLSLDGGNTITRTKDGAFVSGQDVSLRVNNYDVANFGETLLTAKAIMVLADGTVIESAEISKSMRDVVEAVNAAIADYSDNQKAAVIDFVTRHKEDMEGWDISNITG